MGELHSIQLRTLEAGQPQEYLTDIQGEATLALSRDAAGQLEFDYPNWGVGADKILERLVIRAEIDGVEPAGCRFVYANRTGNRTDLDATQHYTFRQIYDGFRTGVWRAPTTEQTRTWTAQKAGQIMLDAHTAAAGRGCFAWFGPTSFDFTGAVDSRGAAWPKDVTVELQYADKSVFDVWDWLKENGYVELWSTGSVIQAFIPNTRGTNWYSTEGRILYAGTDIDDAPWETDSDDICSSLTVIGDHPTVAGNVQYVTINRTPTTAWGRRERQIRVNGVTSVPVLTDIGNQWIDSRLVEREQRSYRVAPGAAWYPLKDFTIGDYMGMQAGGTLWQEKVVAISVTWDSPTTMRTILTCNDWLDERDRRLEQRLSKLRGN